MADCLALHDVSAGYGETVILERVSLRMAEGGTLAVLGRNGVGKTTLLASVLGHTTLHAGRIAFRGQQIEGMRPFQRARLGIGYVPQEREIFPSLDVEENLSVAARGTGPWTCEGIYTLFPSLAARRRNLGNQLSGGEQQMLAIGRALMGNPSLLLLDEPLEGLAPIIVEELTDAIGRMIADEGTAIMLVEQHTEVALSLTREAVVIERGMIALRGSSQALMADHASLDRLIGLNLTAADSAGC